MLPAATGHLDEPAAPRREDHVRPSCRRGSERDHVAGAEVGWAATHAGRGWDKPIGCAAEALDLARDADTMRRGAGRCSLAACEGLAVSVIDTTAVVSRAGTVSRAGFGGSQVTWASTRIPTLCAETWVTDNRSWALAAPGGMPPSASITVATLPVPVSELPCPLPLAVYPAGRWRSKKAIVPAVVPGAVKKCILGQVRSRGPLRRVA
jgi:hypothetical protein